MKQAFILAALSLCFLSGCANIDTTDPISQTAAANDLLTREADGRSISTPLPTVVASIVPTLSASYTPSLAVSTPSPSQTMTETQLIQTEIVSDQTILNCAVRNIPELPCLWRVLLGDAGRNISGDSFFSIALRAYGSYEYALMVLNFNRDDLGYQARLGVGNGRKEFLYLPLVASVKDPLEPEFPHFYPNCNEFDEGQEKPCIYLAQQGDTYSEIARRFYSVGMDAVGCIRTANFLIDMMRQEFRLLLEADGLEGRTLILPILKDC